MSAVKRPPEEIVKECIILIDSLLYNRRVIPGTFLLVLCKEGLVRTLEEIDKANKK